MAITSTPTVSIDTQSNFICMQICTPLPNKNSHVIPVRNILNSLLAIFLGKEITQYYVEELAHN